jgi:hypothetical protein
MKKRIFDTVITADTVSADELIANRYFLVSVSDLCDGGGFPLNNLETRKIIGICVDANTKAHADFSDFKAAQMLYLNKLNAFGVDKFLERLDALLKGTKLTKIALVGSNQSGFCYRHVVADWLISNGHTDVCEYGVIKADYKAYLDTRRAIWEHDTYKNTGIEILSDGQLEKMLENHPWVFARTMPTHPHHYTLRKKWNEAEWLKAYLNIREKGVIENFGNKIYRVFYGTEFKYWTMPCGYHRGTRIASNIVLINKTKIKSGN